VVVEIHPSKIQPNDVLFDNICRINRFFNKDFIQNVANLSDSYKIDIIRYIV